MDIVNFVIFFCLGSSVDYNNIILHNTKSDNYFKSMTSKYPYNIPMKSNCKLKQKPIVKTILMYSIVFE